MITLHGLCELLEETRVIFYQSLIYLLITSFVSGDTQTHHFQPQMQLLPVLKLLSEPCEMFDAVIELF